MTAITLANHCSFPIGPRVEIQADGRSNYRYGSICYTGERFYTTGIEYETTATNGTFSKGDWLFLGSSSDYYIEYTRTSGYTGGFNSTSKTSGTRYQISSNQIFTMSALNLLRSLTVTWEIWDTASGGTALDTVTGVVYVAESETGGGCPLCCFTPDTLITMGNGLTMPIKDVREGDRILTYDKIAKKNLTETIDEVIVRENVPIFEVRFEDGRSILTSPDHPFHTAEKGPASIGWHEDYKGVGVPGELAVGDHVLTQDGVWLKVTYISRKLRNEPVVFTFGNWLFYANGLLVY